MRRRRWWGWMTVPALAAVMALAAGDLTAATAAGAGSAAPAGDRESRKRWALARMDEMAQERLRCRERFRVDRQARECEEEFARRHRAYNQLYLEALRE